MIPTPPESTRLTPVTVLGLGPMGRALASAFLNARHPVTVWNRTPGKTGDLPHRGAMVVDSVQDAVRAGEVVIVCLIDYDAVWATLEDLPADWEHRRLINLTSGEPAQARRMSRWASARGIDYLDGAILTPTPAIGTPAGAVLLSGSLDVYEAVRETMDALGGTVTHLGDDPGQASAYEVALLDIFATSVNGIVHAFALASAEGIEPERFAALATGIGGLLPEMITRFAQQIRADHYPGDRSTIASAASGITHVINTATGHGIDAAMLTAAKGVIDRAIADGYGSEGLARLANVLHKGGTGSTA
ncbi:NAD(P)-dependent oxidoreductase [Streptomyces antibioticus]|uniref:NAD(P)-dependent oxidoreductase n=1 Tax=Streptomyces antibioticus TaxID=1890 RepID=UPI0033BF0CB1